MSFPPKCDPGENNHGSHCQGSKLVLHRRHSPSTWDNSFGLFPSYLTLRFWWGVRFRGLTTVRFRYDLLLCLPSCRSRPDLRPAIEDVYIRASDGLVTRAVAEYVYSANWVICTE